MLVVKFMNNYESQQNITSKDYSISILKPLIIYNYLGVLDISLILNDIEYGVCR